MKKNIFLFFILTFFLALASYLEKNEVEQVSIKKEDSLLLSSSLIKKFSLKDDDLLAAISIIQEMGIEENLKDFIPEGSPFIEFKSKDEKLQITLGSFNAVSGNFYILFKKNKEKTLYVCYSLAKVKTVYRSEKERRYLQYDELYNVLKHKMSNLGEK